MSLPAISRAFWSSTGHCRDCGKPRPFFLMALKYRCIPCNRIRNVEKMRKSRLSASELRVQLTKHADISRKDKIRPHIRRCRDNFYKIRSRAPNSIPKWVTIDSLLPIYEYAELLDDEDPDFRHVVSHVYPIATDKSVCGLHRIENLRVIKSPVSKISRGYPLTGRPLLKNR
jgi:hypothetical protein